MESGDSTQHNEQRFNRKSKNTSVGADTMNIVGGQIKVKWYGVETSINLEQCWGVKILMQMALLWKKS